MLWMGQTRKIKSVKVDSVSLLLCGSIEPIAQSNDEAHSKFFMRDGFTWEKATFSESQSLFLDTYV